MAVLSKLFEDQRAEYQQDPQAADQLVAIGSHPVPVRNEPRRAGGVDKRLPHDPQPARNDHPQLRHAMTLPARIGRRTFVMNSGVSLGSMALASMLPRTNSVQAAAPAQSGRWTGVIGKPPLVPRAKRIIWLYMAGGMSHLDTFDHKPLLEKLSGQPMPESVTKGQQIAQLQGAKLRVFKPQHPFKKWGQSGQSISVIWPELASKCADEMCIVRSLHTDAINHDPAHTFMNTGSMIAGRPAMGSWLWYGLGNDAQSLPGFVVMVSTGNFGQKQPIAARQWHSGFLPSRFQGVEFRSVGDPVLYLKNPAGVTAKRQREFVDAVETLNQIENNATTGCRDRHPHQPIRNGLSDADERAGADGRSQ